MSGDELLEIVKRLKAMADTGLLYAVNEYDRERYEELQATTLQLFGRLSGHNETTIQASFPAAIDYPTAKVDIRAFVLSPDKRILLVQEKSDGRWALPGGWGEVGFTPAETAVKECWEEAGLPVDVRRLLAVFDKRKHPHPPEGFYVFKFVFWCEAKHFAIQKGHEVLDAAFFSIDDLPPLSENRILATQIRLVYDKVMADDQLAYFD